MKKQTPTIIRSVLFVPGNQPERIKKAIATAADVVIMDLEDAVPRAEKQVAREVIRDTLQQNRERRLWVRVNGPDTEWIQTDMDAVVTTGLSGVIIPKLETARQAVDVHGYLADCGRKQGIDVGDIAFVPLVETALSVQNAYDIACASIDDGQVFTLAFGAADFTADMGINMTTGGAELNYPRARIAVACRAAGIQPPLDTPYMIDIRDKEGLVEDAQRARRLGFQGKLCIHPLQLEVVNDVFSPAADEIAFAIKVIEAYEDAVKAGRAAVQVDGKFIDPPIVARAEQIVDWEKTSK